MRAPFALQALVSRLRRLVPGVLESSATGSRLAVPAGAVDAVRFEALALWRGPALMVSMDAPLVDCSGAAWTGPLTPRSHPAGTAQIWAANPSTVDSFLRSPRVRRR